MNEINFSYNWNNKLFCDAFTTLRLHNPLKYRADEIYSIRFKNLSFQAKIIDVSKFENLNNFIAFLDTGDSLEDCRKIILKIRPNTTDITLFDFILLNRLDQNDIQHSLFGGQN